MYKEIKYIGFYDLPDSKTNRVSNLAATNKMDYVCSALNRGGYNVNIVSPSWMGANSKVRREGKVVKNINKKTKVTFCPSWITHKKITLRIKVIFSLLWLFIYLLVNVKKTEKIIAYHVQWISIPIRLAKYFKRFELILEVEEIYSKVWETSKYMSYIEEKLIKSADSYIYVSELLRKELGEKNKKSLILYGSYNQVELKSSYKNSKVVDLIYAGSIDPIKGGAFKAVEIMRHLPKNYKLHILGHGNIQHINKLKTMIKTINTQKSREVCFYVGTLYGEKYSEYLLACDIALNPQKQGDYMTTAFPSKLLSYLSHNLRVVSTEIESVKQSQVTDYILFSKNDKPEEFAEIIKEVDLTSQYNSSDFINQLDKDFINNIKQLLRN